MHQGVPASIVRKIFRAPHLIKKKEEIEKEFRGDIQMATKHMKR